MVGVLPPGFPFAPGLDARVVVAVQPRGERATRRSLNWIRPIARLRDGVGVVQAQKQLAAFEDALRERFPDALGGVLTDVTPLRDELVGRVEPVLLLLFVCVSLVLLVACVNVANLLLARAAGRQTEGSRSASPSGPGAPASSDSCSPRAGCWPWPVELSGSWRRTSASRCSSPAFPRGSGPGCPSSKPWRWTGGSSATGRGSSSSPRSSSVCCRPSAPRGRSSRLGGRMPRPPRAGRFRYGVRDLLVTAEIALAVMLLGSAGLMGKSLLRALSTDPGFRPEGLVGLELSLAEPGAPDPGGLVALRAKVQDSVEAVPGVSLAARVNRMPATGSGGSHSFVRPERPRPTGPEPEAYFREVSAGYFRTLGIPLLAGRDFGPEDSRGSAAVVIVNRALQQRYFPGEDAIGKTLRPISWSTGAPPTIVGVVADQTLGGLDEARPAILYYPDTQAVSPRWALVVRSDRAGVGEELRRAIREVAPGLVVGPTRPLGEVLREAPSMALRRYPVFLLGVFAAVALVLACVGIFGVVSFGVAGRTREFGIRMAVGAVRRDIVGLVLRGSSAPIVAGTLAGLAGSVALATLFRGLLFGVASSDPGILASVACVLGTVAVVSALLPALRAARVDPAVALRSL